MSFPARTHRPLLAAAAIFGLLAGIALGRWLLPPTVRPLPWKMGGEWIAASAAPAPIGYFRKTLELPGTVRTAWIAVAARDAFEVSVNGAVVGAQTLWRPNRAFQFASTERGQRINEARAIPGVPYPREYQWEPQAGERVPVFIDLSRQLQPGRNVLCVRVDSRQIDHCLRLDGEAVLVSGARLSLASDPSWKVTTLPSSEAGAEWIECDYNDRGWAAATHREGTENFFRMLDPAIFSEPFTGRELTSGSVTSPVCFETTWRIEEVPREAWLRVALNRAYDLVINGRKALPATLGASELSAGAWVAHTLFATGQRWQPAALDPEDAGSLFPETTERTGTTAPTALLRDSQVGTFDAFNVSGLLHAGENRVSLRMIDRGATFQWSPRVAVDGLARGSHSLSRLVSNAASWTGSSNGKILPLTEISAQPEQAAQRPQLRYLGAAESLRWREWALAFAALLLAISAAAFAQKLTAPDAARCTAGLFAASAVLASALILDACFAVRDEALWMAQPAVWAGLLALAIGVGGATWRVLRGAIIPFPIHRRTIRALLIGVLVICGITRAYRADFQPTDADEWASLQTVLAIVHTGTPQLTADAYYTRSPLYHYLTAGSVVLFGETFWATRLPGAAFAIATCGLIYLCGARLLHSRWVGLGAAALFTLHPLAIDMGHQIRFYQQQQFFALLTFYFFCRGFVARPRMSARYAMLAAFFAAVFSQEISVMMAFTLFPAYLLFARGVGWRREAGWLLAAGCGLVFVVLDFVIFQTVCLTRLEGVSPRIEPALGLNFMYPSTLYWIFSLNSRLHLGLSVLFFAGLPCVLRTGNRHAHAMLLTFFSGLVFTTILITGAGVRFQYWLFPLFLLLAVYSAQQLAAFAVGQIGNIRRLLGGRHRALEWGLAATLVLMVALSFSPWKIPGSYATKLLPDVDGAFAYVRQNIIAGDALAVAAPHTAAAICELGHVDYDLELPLLHDFVYRKNGRLIDRNGGAQVIAKVDDFQDAIAQHERIWVVLNRDIRFRSPGSRIAWQSPGARFDLFVRTNLQLVHQTYLTDVFLWDQSKGRLRGFRRSL